MLEQLHWSAGLRERAGSRTRGSHSSSWPPRQGALAKVTTAAPSPCQDHPTPSQVPGVHAGIPMLPTVTHPCRAASFLAPKQPASNDVSEELNVIVGTDRQLQTNGLFPAPMH